MQLSMSQPWTSTGPSASLPQPAHFWVGPLDRLSKYTGGASRPACSTIGWVFSSERNAKLKTSCKLSVLGVSWGEPREGAIEGACVALQTKVMQWSGWKRQHLEPTRPLPDGLGQQSLHEGAVEEVGDRKCCRGRGSRLIGQGANPVHTTGKRLTCMAPAPLFIKTLHGNQFQLQKYQVDGI